MPLRVWLAFVTSILALVPDVAAQEYRIQWSGGRAGSAPTLEAGRTEQATSEAFAAIFPEVLGPLIQCGGTPYACRSVTPVCITVANGPFPVVYQDGSWILYSDNCGSVGSTGSWDVGVAGDDACGDGFLDPGEGCDDGNGAIADGCDGTCLVEGGWSCTGEPSICEPLDAGCLPQPAGMIGWWRGEGDGHDSAANRHGTLEGSVTFAPGKVGQAFSFDGGGRVTVPDDEAWAFGASDFSIGAWVRFGVIDSRSPFLGYNDGSGQQNKWIFWYDEQGHDTPPGPALRFHINSPAIGPQDPGHAPWTPGTGWHHVAVTRSSSVYTMYVDGVSIGSRTDTDTIPNATGPLTIGQSEAFWFRGLVDEAMIFHRALAATEIAAIHGAGATGLCVEECNDGIDNDGDGRVDFPDDPGCLDVAASREDPQCQDGVDNDGQPGTDSDGGASLDLDDDGFIDAEFDPATPPVGSPDPQCIGYPAKNREAVRGCGLGAGIAFMLAGLRPFWRRCRGRQQLSNDPPSNGLGPI